MSKDRWRVICTTRTRVVFCGSGRGSRLCGFCNEALYSLIISDATTLKAGKI